MLHKIPQRLASVNTTFPSSRESVVLRVTSCGKAGRRNAHANACQNLPSGCRNPQPEWVSSKPEVPLNTDDSDSVVLCLATDPLHSHHCRPSFRTLLSLVVQPPKPSQARRPVSPGSAYDAVRLRTTKVKACLIGVPVESNVDTRRAPSPIMPP